MAYVTHKRNGKIERTFVTSYWFLRNGDLFGNCLLDDFLWVHADDLIDVEVK